MAAVGFVVAQPVAPRVIAQPVAPGVVVGVGEALDLEGVDPARPRVCFRRGREPHSDIVQFLMLNAVF